MTFNIHTVHVHLVLLKIHLLIYCKAFLIKYPLIFLLIFLLSKSFHISSPHAILIRIQTFLAKIKTQMTHSLKCRPIVLQKPSQLVYSGHIYPFSPVISDLEYSLFKLTMHAMQTFVADVGFNYSAPYWMGEFGTGEDSENWGKIGKTTGFMWGPTILTNWFSYLVDSAKFNLKKFS